MYGHSLVLVEELDYDSGVQSYSLAVVAVDQSQPLLSRYDRLRQQDSETCLKRLLP